MYIYIYMAHMYIYIMTHSHIYIYIMAYIYVCVCIILFYRYRYYSKTPLKTLDKQDHEKNHAQRRGKGFTCHVAFDTGTGVLAGPRHMVEALKQDAFRRLGRDGTWMALEDAMLVLASLFQRKPWIFL